MGVSWRLMIHGGAGSMNPAKLDPRIETEARTGLEESLDAGAEILRLGGSAVEAVEAAARSLEENPCFNAGRGSVLAMDGHIELDAAIMDGRSRRAGAVAALRSTRAPISLAKYLMEKGPHLLLAGPDADRFAAESGFEQVENHWFQTAERRRQLDEFITHGGFDEQVKYGTIGAVAVDANGHVAAATSTGGLTGKQWGRIGDSPLVGAGTYADDRSAAVSATGSGEYFIRTVAAHEVAARVRIGGETLRQALDGVLAEIQSLGGIGGLIAVTPSGEAEWAFTTSAMYRGEANASGRRVAIYADEEER